MILANAMHSEFMMCTMCPLVPCTCCLLNTTANKRTIFVEPTLRIMATESSQSGIVVDPKLPCHSPPSPTLEFYVVPLAIKSSQVSSKSNLVTLLLISAVLSFPTTKPTMLTLTTTMKHLYLILSVLREIRIVSRLPALQVLQTLHA